MYLHDSVSVDFTVTWQLALLPLCAVAVIVAVPGLTAVTSPELLTLAVYGSVVVHVRVLFPASAGRMLAVSCSVSDSFNTNSDLFNETEVTGVGLRTVTVHVAEAELNFSLTVIVHVPLAMAVIKPSVVTVATAELLDEMS